MVGGKGRRLALSIPNKYVGGVVEDSVLLLQFGYLEESLLTMIRHTMIRLLPKGAGSSLAVNSDIITSITTWEKRHRGYRANHASIVRTVSSNSSPLTSHNEGEEKSDRVVR